VRAQAVIEQRGHAALLAGFGGFAQRVLRCPGAAGYVEGQRCFQADLVVLEEDLAVLLQQGQCLLRAAGSQVGLQ
jgi:hypothetical protein